MRLTNAKKVTDSVLYWYEKLSGPSDQFLEEPKGSFSICLSWVDRWAVVPHCARTSRYRVRPYLVENTVSRPICEVKQPQA